MFSTRWWQPGGTDDVDNAFVQQHDLGFGAEIMGVGKFGHAGWRSDPEWKRITESRLSCHLVM